MNQLEARENEIKRLQEDNYVMDGCIGELKETNDDLMHANAGLKENNDDLEQANYALNQGLANEYRRRQDLERRIKALKQFHHSNAYLQNEFHEDFISGPGKWAAGPANKKRKHYN